MLSARRPTCLSPARTGNWSEAGTSTGRRGAPPGSPTTTSCARDTADDPSSSQRRGATSRASRPSSRRCGGLRPRGDGEEPAETLAGEIGKLPGDSTVVGRHDSPYLDRREAGEQAAQL